MTGFLGYSNDRFKQFKEIKVKVFHEKNGWFTKPEDTSLTVPSTVNTTMCAAGTIMALDVLYSETTEKVVGLCKTCKLEFEVFEH
jgi:hypothetical protein